MKCKNCGTENSDERSFCKVCGDYLNNNVQNSTEDDTDKKNEDITKKEPETHSGDGTIENTIKSEKKNKNTVYTHCVNIVPDYMISPFSRWIAFGLCIVLGFLGLHRFYVGKTVSGVFYILTLGFCGIGIIVDAILLVRGSFKDKQKLYLQK